MRKILQALVAGCVIAWSIEPCCAQSESAHAYIVASTSKKTIVYLDIKTLVQIGNVVTAWTIWINYPEEKVPAEGSVAYNIQQNIFDCGERTWTIKYMADYDDGGNSLSNTVGNQIFNPVIPDSLGERLLKYAC